MQYNYSFHDVLTFKPFLLTFRKFNITYNVLKPEVTFFNQEQSTQIKTCILELKNCLKQN